jgi:hypothetical protein
MTVYIIVSRLQGKANLFVKDNLLHRCDKIVGQPVNQLVLPVGRRVQAMKLAH